MRHPLLPFVCLALLTGCSVDRYTLRGRVMTDGFAGATALNPAKADSLAGRPQAGAVVTLVVDPDDSLHRRELGTFECDANGWFEVHDVSAVGVEMLPYQLRVDAFAKHCTPLHCDMPLPGPGKVLVLRLAENPEARRTEPPTPPRRANPTDDYLRNTLRESEPYLTGGK